MIRSGRSSTASSGPMRRALPQSKAQNSRCVQVGRELAMDPIDGEEAVLVRHRGIACEVDPDVATRGLEREAGAEQ